MNMEFIKASAIKLVGRGILQTKKYAPEILTGTGIVGVVAAAVMAAKATYEIDEKMFPSRAKRQQIKEYHEKGEDKSYTDDMYQKDIALSYIHSTQALAKLYGPSLAVGTASIVCILAAHGIMRQRNAALVLAYNTVSEAFKAYRARVVEEYGPEKDFDYRHGIREEIVETTNENGKVKKAKVLTQDPNAHSQYAKFFDELNVHWERNAEANLFFLRCQQNYANDMLHARGHLFLNDVYRSLGMPDTKAGAIVGWVISKEGDNFVDFGIYDINSPKARDFVNGFERSILLDFNVDGVIYDKIEG